MRRIWIPARWHWRGTMPAPAAMRPTASLEVFLDEHFDNARMERIYPNAKKVIKAE